MVGFRRECDGYHLVFAQVEEEVKSNDFVGTARAGEGIAVAEASSGE